MPDENDEVHFSFSWLALRLLGRGLYSNPWSALSELVANGLDAQAGNVWVFVDARDKAHATVEVIDDGSGMSREDITTYVKVGHNKRSDAIASGDADSNMIKGRKGIGKLAALFLSQHFFLQTRHASDASSWELDARDGTVADDEYPRLTAAAALPRTSNDELWAAQVTGTRLTMLDVNLTGYGQQSMAVLGSRLANQFLLPNNATPRVLLAVRTADLESAPEYSVVEKRIAFGNFVEVLKNFPDGSIQPADLSSPPESVKVRAVGLPDDEYSLAPSYEPFPDAALDDDALAQIEVTIDTENRTYGDDQVPYELSGWIGVHASINADLATKNDDRFVRNKFYNPAQIRVYVRGKLASEHLLSQLGFTGTYANYIEGEISFDLLDDDNLPDIATSNRQDFDETDSRVTLLRALVRPIVRKLITGRNQLAERVSDLVKQEKDRKKASGKQQFTEQLRDDFEQHPEIPGDVSAALQAVISNKIQGEVAVKSEYKVFLSHSAKDAAFASLIDDLLQAKGATKDEIFFTSRVGEIAAALTDEALGLLVKSNLLDANTLIFYMTSSNFLLSQFCLFEAGAGWATRAVSAYLKLNVDFASIPAWLTNGRAEVELMATDRSLALRPEVHNYLIAGVLNPMIEHLNRGRATAGTAEIEYFDLPEFPTAVQLANEGRVLADYFDPLIVEHWDVLIQPGIQAYLDNYPVVP